MSYVFFFFFFQAEDGIRDGRVTGVQTCALPISGQLVFAGERTAGEDLLRDLSADVEYLVSRSDQRRERRAHEAAIRGQVDRSEERRVGKECRCRWWADQ